MGSEYFAGRTTPETWVGTGGDRMWKMKRRGGKNASISYEDDKDRMNTQQSDESDTDTEALPDEDGYTEDRYSESEFHAELEEENEGRAQELAKQEAAVDRGCEETHIEVSHHPPSVFEEDSHLLHIDFVTDELNQLGMGRPANRRVGSLSKKLPGQQHNISFSRERVREIERTNHILLRKILSTRPTLQTQAGVLRQTKSTGSANSSRVTSAALNRNKGQKKSANENGADKKHWFSKFFKGNQCSSK
uniref:Uncharacterized protein n=1 Tax=Anopheles atroparvus TaxID=41427 RepID=A0A240PJY0_ANOAO